MSGTYYKKGRCVCCRKVYDKHVTQVDSDPSSDVGKFDDVCPNCGYDPSMRDIIAGIIDDDVSVTFNHGDLSVNSEELSRGIEKILLEKWPRPESK